MSPRTLLFLVVLGVVALCGGWYYGVTTAPTEQQSFDAGKLVFPGLAPQLQQVTKIEIVHQGKPVIIEKHGDSWGLVERDLYPVQDTKLREMLTGLTELRLVEPRTADPTKYAQLGVEDPDDKDTNGTSNLLRLLDGTGKPIVALIVGHRRVRTQGNVPEQVYVRRPGEAQSWLAEGSLQVDADPQLWLDRDIMNLDHARIAAVETTRDGATLAFARDGDKLVLKQPTDHPKLDDYKQEDVARALELLTFQDVHKSTDQAHAEVGHSVFTTTDGLAITATVFHPPPPAPNHPEAAAKSAADKDVWVRFAVTGNDKTKAEADRLETKVKGWTYQLGSWKEKSLLPSIDSLKAAEPEKPPAPAAPPDSSTAPAAPAMPAKP